MEILFTALAIIACIALFSFAIFIHEFGHFVAARKLGLAVDAFSIGFGPVLWKKVHNGVEWRISAIPFGGYVSIPQVDPEGTQAVQGTTQSEAPKIDLPPWKAIIVAVAGPMGNVVLAVVLALLLACVPGAHFGELSTEIGRLIPKSAAETGGLLPGDRVTAVNGHSVSTWTEMQTEVQIAGARSARFDVVRGGTNVALSVTAMREPNSGAFFIGAISATNQAARAAAWMPARNPLRQLEWDALSIVRVLKALVTPKEAKAAAQALGGPVMIAEGLYVQVRRNGWDALGFLRFLCVNLAILNLLPIPVLDGGLVLFALLELLFRRKMPEKVVNVVSHGFMYVLMALFAILIYRDTMRSWRIHHNLPKAAAEANASTNAVNNLK